MSQAEKVDSNQENLNEKKKKQKVETTQPQAIAESDIEQYYDIWKFTRGDIIAMVIGGILGGVFSISVLRLLGQ